MSNNKPRKTRKAGTSVYPEQKPKLRLLRPLAECATTDIITELSQEVKVMLQGMRQKAVTSAGDDEPEAA